MVCMTAERMVELLVAIVCKRVDSAGWWGHVPTNSRGKSYFSDVPTGYQFGFAVQTFDWL